MVRSLRTKRPYPGASVLGLNQERQHGDLQTIWLIPEHPRPGRLGPCAFPQVLALLFSQEGAVISASVKDVSFFLYPRNAS
ncbi:Mitogen-activated protein kinase-binding protein 1 [Manis javanica]|nr:Mitogen-activated protein kinase-binding protein 1 [Manis javanica]